MLPDALDAVELGSSLKGAADQQFSQFDMARITNFPLGLAAFVDFASAWGDPLQYPGGAAGGSHPGNPAVHHVRYEKRAAERGELHALQGPLALHSAHSLREPRPRFFAMLMVNAGWQDGPPGTNGESLLVRWRDVLARFSADDVDIEPLRGRQPYPGGRDLDLIYPLSSPRDEFDLGVRMKYDLRPHWVESFGESSTHVRALDAFAERAASSAHQLGLRDGELVIVDNDRWGHGRRSVRGEREKSSLPNPRELWSITLG